MKQKIIFTILANIIYFYLRFVILTSHVRFINQHYIEEAVHHKGAIFSFWHDTLAIVGHAWFPYKKREIGIIISPHKDGVLASYLFQKFNMKAIYGSSGKHGARAYRDTLRYVQNNPLLASPADGPRGPRHIAKTGLARIAQKQQLPIIPISYVCKRKKILNTWDHLVFPFPFNHIIIAIGEAFTISDDINSEQARLLFEEKLQHHDAATQKLLPC